MGVVALIIAPQTKQIKNSFGQHSSALSLGRRVARFDLTSTSVLSFTKPNGFKTKADRCAAIRIKNWLGRRSARGIGKKQLLTANFKSRNLRLPFWPGDPVYKSLSP